MITWKTHRLTHAELSQELLQIIHIRLVTRKRKEIFEIWISLAVDIDMDLHVGGLII